MYEVQPYKMDQLNPLFICGYAKSGTSLMLSLLDSHPELLVYPDELKIFQRIMPLESIEEKINCILTKTAAKEPALGIVEVASGTRDYSSVDGEKYLNELIDALNQANNDKELLLAWFSIWKKFSSVSQSKELKYFVEKTPDNEFYIDIIKEWFKKPFFIHVVRDPRDNYTSYSKKNLNLTLESFCYGWQQSTQIGLSQKGSNYLLIKYEDLVGDTKNTLDKICKFLGISYNNSLTVPTINNVRWAGNSMFGDNLGEIHSKAINRYKEKLLEKEISDIEGYLFDEMNDLEYNCGIALNKKQFPAKHILEKSKPASILNILSRIKKHIFG